MQSCNPLIRLSLLLAVLSHRLTASGTILPPIKFQNPIMPFSQASELPAWRPYYEAIARDHPEELGRRKSRDRYVAFIAAEPLEAVAVNSAAQAGRSRSRSAQRAGAAFLGGGGAGSVLISTLTF